MEHRRVEVPMDSRSAYFVTTDLPYLGAAAADMPLSPHTPAKVAALLDRARRQFLLAGADYDNFADCLGTAFKALELLLRISLGDQAPKGGTMRNLIEKARSLDLLTEYEDEYLWRFALHFRNKLAHPTDVVGFTPGMSAEALGGCHRFVASFCDRTRVPR